MYLSLSIHYLYTLYTWQHNFSSIYCRSESDHLTMLAMNVVSILFFVQGMYQINGRFLYWFCTYYCTDFCTHVLHIIVEIVYRFLYRFWTEFCTYFVQIIVQIVYRFLDRFLYRFLYRFCTDYCVQIFVQIFGQNFVRIFLQIIVQIVYRFLDRFLYRVCTDYCTHFCTDFCTHVLQIFRQIFLVIVEISGMPPAGITLHGSDFNRSRPKRYANFYGKIAAEEAFWDIIVVMAENPEMFQSFLTIYH